MMMSSIFCIVLVFSFHAYSNARPLGFGARESHLKPVPPSRTSDESTHHHHHVIVWAKMDETNSNNDANDSSNVRETSIQIEQDSSADESQDLKKRQGAGRSTLQRDVIEEKVDSKEHEILEDVVAMDYAQPQRKPPIHNQKKP
ncbi:hypothetical protein Leryth_016154 [Lithospermum erythrorhizon]|uniref:Uncharacterized protein n=1 Tax=Lithospermum erythrorhizon TaxID=34254 RepID=A0AAV3PMK7_LITER|nr:hypothetical protein Leryth_016154 [Lithospermum erythrorhizon]